MVILGKNAVDSTIELAKQFPEQRFIFLLPRITSILRPLPENCYVILNNDFDGGFRLAEYYASRGVKKMAILTAELEKDDLTYQTRIKGFLHAADKYGIKFDPENDFIQCNPTCKHFGQRQSAYLATRAYLANRNEIPDVIFAVNDNLAAGSLEAVQSLEYQNCIAVTGYDGVFRSAVISRRFSTVKVPFLEMGKLAVKLANGTDRMDQVIEMSPELILDSGETSC